VGVGDVRDRKCVPSVRGACRCTLQRRLEGRRRKLNNHAAQSLSRDGALFPASNMKRKANPQSTVSVDQICALKILKGLWLATAFKVTVLPASRNVSTFRSS
jgi:hypothetical protein